jgi:hypothetical protein
VIAKLHRFYGPAPTPTGSWLDIPEWLFRAYERAQPRLEAEEYQMVLKNSVAGTGHMKDEDFQQYQRQLERQASGGMRDHSIARPRTAEEMRTLVRGLGMSGFKVDIRG